MSSSSSHCKTCRVQAAQRAGSAISEQYPAVHLQTWVDDVSLMSGLRLNPDKTGFITSSKETAANALKGLLQPGDPAHYDVFRDLGIDATAARRRRVTQVRKRFQKGRARAGIAHRLKLNRSVKYRLHKRAIHPVMTWGPQANGLAPQRRQQVRVMAAKGLRLQRSGSVDIIFDMNKKHPDPHDPIVLRRVHTVWKIYHSFDESKQHLFKTTWNTALGALLGAKHRSLARFKLFRPTCWAKDSTFKMVKSGIVQDMPPSLTALCPWSSSGPNWSSSSKKSCAGKD